MPPRRCSSFWAALALLAAPCRLLGSNAGASAPGSRTRLRGPRRATNASSALQLVQPGVASNEVVRRLPAPDRRRRLSDYAQLAKLTASDAASGDSFGRSVAIEGDTIVIGGGEAAYIFHTSDGGASYSQLAKLTASDAATGDSFGVSVAIAGNTFVIGSSYDDDGGTSTGSAYVFRTSDGGATYGQVAKLTASDAASFDYFGCSVAIAGATIVVGAYQDDDGGDLSGSAYLFSEAGSEGLVAGSDSDPTPQPTTAALGSDGSDLAQTPQPTIAALGSDAATRTGPLLALLVAAGLAL